MMFYKISKAPHDKCGAGGAESWWFNGPNMNVGSRTTRTTFAFTSRI